MTSLHPRQSSGTSRLAARIAFRSRSTFSPLLLLLAICVLQRHSPAQTKPTVSAEQLVKQMVQAENLATDERQHFSYKQTERSSRTKGHLWQELVVETTEGRMRRLVAVDGKPLSEKERSAEASRIAWLVNHPADFRKESQARRDDQARLAGILKEVPAMYLFQVAGTQGDCTRITFAPNPQFQEVSFQDRVVHAMSGSLLIHPTDNRLCGMDAHVDHTVEFGFGLLGKVSPQSHFSMVRQQVSAGQWKTTRLNVHVDGSILFMKSISRDEESSHEDFHPVPAGLTVAQAAAMGSPAGL